MIRKIFSLTKIKKKLKNIKIVVFDIDGVLTDGRITYDSSGKEYKSFNIKDGSGIKQAIDSGIKVIWLSGRQSEANRKRAKELGITKLYEGILKKKSILLEISKEFNVSLDEICYVGDDVIDLQAVQMAGVGVAVADAHKDLKKSADMVLKTKGGFGAAREIIDLILKLKNLTTKARQRYTA